MGRTRAVLFCKAGPLKNDCLGDGLSGGSCLVLKARLDSWHFLCNTTNCFSSDLKKIIGRHSMKMPQFVALLKVVKNETYQ